MKITAIVSDYDGTLCPTDSITGSKGKIPEDLETVLWSISRTIPVCILSSKDHIFLEGKTGFSSIVTCINGAEYFVYHQRPDKQVNKSKITVDSLKLKKIMGPDGIFYVGSMPYHDLEQKSLVLEKISEMILQNFQDVFIEEKRRFTDKLLVGITIDYRHLKKWDQYKTNIEPYLIKLIRSGIEEQSNHSSSYFYIQQYLDHPFIDVYTFKADKGSGLKMIKKLIEFREQRQVTLFGRFRKRQPCFCCIRHVCWN